MFSTRSIDAVMRHEKILTILQQLVSPAIRYDTSKLNMKSPGYGAPSSGTRTGPSIRTPTTIFARSA